MLFDVELLGYPRRSRQELGLTAIYIRRSTAALSTASTGPPAATIIPIVARKADSSDRRNTLKLEVAMRAFESGDRHGLDERHYLHQDGRLWRGAMNRLDSGGRSPRG